MTFARVNPVGWALYEVLTSAQMNQLDINVSRALDGYAGGDNTPSSPLRVHGKIIGDDIPRGCIIPIEWGMPQDADHWTWNVGTYRWQSDNVAGRAISFGLNRIIPHDAYFGAALVVADPGATQTGTNRLAVRLCSRNYLGEDLIIHDVTYYPDETGHSKFAIAIPSGLHNGGDNQSMLTDSLKSWQTNELVGGRIENITDSSEGTITANTATTITAALSGGGENLWDDDDYYRIELVDSLLMNTVQRMYYLAISSSNASQYDYLHLILVAYRDSDDYMSNP